jgi:hypothetical protein
LRFLLAGGGDLWDVSFDLTLVRGDHDWEIEDPPTGCIGFLNLYKPAPDLDDLPMFVSGQCSCPSEICDDHWHKINTPTEFFSVSMALQVGPTYFEQYDLAWDYNANRYLFITEIDFHFVRKIRKPRGIWSGADQIDDEDLSSS